jgi:hypothetical protein
LEWFPQEVSLRRRDGSPIWLSDDQSAVVLKRADLDDSGGSESYNEAWLQRVLYENPQVFPIEQIEPGFGDLISLCCELPLFLGGALTVYLDNLFVTPNGGLVIVEVKLWRNPEARRSAIAQAMEYAAAIFRMGYNDLEAVVQKARAARGLPPSSLFGVVSSQYAHIDQTEFHDAVARNLARGRAVIAVLGDGIREEMLSLATLVQGHAGHRFTFALVELAVYDIGANARVIVPSVLTQTVLIERGVVRVENDSKQGLKNEITAAALSSSNAPANKRISINEDEFFESLGKKDTTLPDVLRAFLTKAEVLGVYSSFQGGLNIKHPGLEGKQPLNMGTITKDGFVDTGPSTWFGRGIPGAAYNEALAAAIGGQIKASTYQMQEAGIRTADGRMVRLSDLLPQHEGLWLDAMSRYISQTCGPNIQADDKYGTETGTTRNLSEEELRKLAHERVWGQTGQQFEKLERVWPDDTGNEAI